MKNLFCAILLTAMFTSCDKTEDKAENKPTACFTYKHYYTSSSSSRPNMDSVVFENCSTNANAYVWDFGGDITSTEENPTYVFEAGLPAVVKLMAFNEENSDILTDTIFDWAVVYKPNIYIYPESSIDLCVTLNFPKGGKVVASIPEYNNEWCVTVEPTGSINGSYDFLFYESTQANIWQKEVGWIIPQNELSNFFNKNMLAYGFNDNEIADFIEYWIPLLKESNYYAIYPQTKTIIERVIELEFSVNPKNLNRLFYVIEGANKEFSISEPVINPFNKLGYYVNEWGVIF